MADDDLVRRVRSLGNIDLAALLCLTSREHCIISTDAEYLDDLTAELQLVASHTFGLSSTVVDCTPSTTLDDFVSAIYVPQPKPPVPTTSPPLPLQTRGPDSYFETHNNGADSRGTHPRQHQHRVLRSFSSLSPGATPASPSRASLQSTSAAIPQQQIANVILARNLDTAPKDVQIQCLELMRTRRILTRPNSQLCPKQFLLVAVLSSDSAGQARLTKHLNEHFYISHWQDPEDGFPYLDEEEDEKGEEEYRRRNIYGDANSISGDKGGQNDDTTSQASFASVVRPTRSSKASSTPVPTPKRTSEPGHHITTIDWALPERDNSQAAASNNYNNISSNSNTVHRPLLNETDISTLSTLSLQTHVDIEVQRYLMNIIAFLRLHRAVTPGSVPPSATTHFRTLVRALAALHGLEFATPELVQLAARKIYPHHLVIVTAERERSMQWGSDLAAVKARLEDVQPEDVVEDVLGMVDVPL